MGFNPLNRHRKESGPWEPNKILIDSVGLDYAWPMTPRFASQHFIVNVSRQVIQRAMLSSKINFKKGR